jgi:hypothetical protein
MHVFLEVGDIGACSGGNFQDKGTRLHLQFRNAFQAMVRFAQNPHVETLGDVIARGKPVVHRLILAVRTHHIT